MDVSKAIEERRTIRRFTEKEISAEALENLVNAARVSPTAMNKQPLEFIIVHKPENRGRILPLINFGGAIKQKALQKGEEPKAYIIVLKNNEKASPYSNNDVGIAVLSIALSAWAKGIGCCIMGAINREEMAKSLNVPEHCEIGLVLSLGYPKEKPVAEESNDEIRYWIEDNELHVPKRPLESILHREKY